MGEEKKPIYKKWWLWVIGIVVVIGIASMAGGGGKDDNASSSSSSQSSETTGSAETPDEPAQETVITVSAAAYYEAYESNELAADKKYEDKKIEISGVVSAVESTMGTIYVNLKADDIIATVSCELEDKTGAESLSKGDMVTLVGVGDGKIGFPRVRDCKIK